MSEKSVQSQTCYQQLRRMVLLGQVPAGERFREVEWASRMGVHRSSLREALSGLAHEGLIRRGERGGFFAPLYEQRDLDEVLEVRAILEAGAIRLIGARPPEDVPFGRLTEACDMMRQLLESDMELGFVEADRRFHQILIELTENQKLISIYQRAPLPILFSRHVDVERRRRGAIQTLDEHQKLTQLLMDRRTDEAVELLQHHLQHATERLLVVNQTR
ncbi:MAG: GntR family transcriptional regulator [Phycisphaerales bacterium]|nr:GntR family transcriptional regulator [Phycisphaerales bacterium]